MLKEQERFAEKAFRSGMDAALNFLASLNGCGTSQEIAELLRWFHRHNKAALLPPKPSTTKLRPRRKH